MTWLWHGVCEDSSCLLSFQRSKPVTGGGVLVKLLGNCDEIVVHDTNVLFAGVGLPFYQSTITKYDEKLSL